MNSPNDNTNRIISPDTTSSWTILEEVLRDGARRMLQTVIESEVNDFVEKHKNKTDEDGHQLVTKNGSRKPRDLITGLGPIEIKQPRVDDRKLRANTSEEGFSSEQGMMYNSTL